MLLKALKRLILFCVKKIFQNLQFTQQSSFKKKIFKTFSRSDFLKYLFLKTAIPPSKIFSEKKIFLNIFKSFQNKLKSD